MALMRSLMMLIALSNVVVFTQAAVAQSKRIALVIGNSDYQHTSTLPNPKNDAADMTAALNGLGFTVIGGIDLTKSDMEKKIRAFAEALNGASAGLFFYAGHGLQVAGQNYLVPVDAKLTSSAGLDFELIRLDLIQRAMEREVATNILFLDACRDNPLSRNLARALGTRSTQVGKGLAAAESGEGTLISYSTQPGNVAYDGDGRNSPFAKALLKHISTAGETLPSILIRVRNDVMNDTGRRQVPWEHSAMTAPFYFTAPQPSAPTATQQLELSFWNSVKDSASTEVIATYLERYPDGTFSSLARALIEQRKRQAKAAEAAVEREAKIREEERKAADLRRIEEERRSREAALAEAARKARDQRDDQEVARLAEERRTEDIAQAEQLRKALEDVRLAREAARIAEEQRLAAQKAADEARIVAEKAKAAAAAASRPNLDAGDERVRLVGLPKVPDPSAVPTTPFDGAWSVTRTGEGRCGKGRVFSFKVFIRNGIANRGRGSVDADGTFKFTGRGLDGRPASFNGRIVGNKGSGTFRHPACRGTFTMVRG